jgi:hypothetical protein
MFTKHADGRRARPRAKSRETPKRQRGVNRIVATDFRAAFEAPPAKYDLASIEANVAGLIEAGWPPFLGWYAPLLAAGFNGPEQNKRRAPLSLLVRRETSPKRWTSSGRRLIEEPSKS